MSEPELYFLRPILNKKNASQTVKTAKPIIPKIHQMLNPRKILSAGTKTMNPQGINVYRKTLITVLNIGGG